MRLKLQVDGSRWVERLYCSLVGAASAAMNLAHYQLWVPRRSRLKPLLQGNVAPEWLTATVPIQAMPPRLTLHS